MARKTITTQVAIMGAGPAGLMLSHLLATQGIESTVVEIRSRREIQETVRAGILEHGTVNMLVDSGVSDRVLREGDRHDGIVLRFNGESHRIDFKQLVGECVWLYPQTDLFMDLAARREADGGDVRYSVSETTVHDLRGKAEGLVHRRGRPGIQDPGRLPGRRRRLPQPLPLPDPGGRPHVVLPRVPVRLVRHTGRGAAQPGRAHLRQLRARLRPRQPAARDRAAHVLPVRPKGRCRRLGRREDLDQFRKRVNGNGFELREGAVLEKIVLPFRSLVHAPMRYGNLFLAGDAAHNVPPTGAKGLNLAIHDVHVLFEALEPFYSTGSTTLLDAFSDRALRTRVESPALLLLDDLHAAHRPGLRRLRARPPARRAEHGGLLSPCPGVPGRGVHGLADVDVAAAATNSVTRGRSARDQRRTA